MAAELRRNYGKNFCRVSPLNPARILPTAGLAWGENGASACHDMATRETINPAGRRPSLNLGSATDGAPPVSARPRGPGKTYRNNMAGRRPSQIPRSATDGTPVVLARPRRYPSPDPVKKAPGPLTRVVSLNPPNPGTGCPCGPPAFGLGVSSCPPAAARGRHRAEVAVCGASLGEDGREGVDEDVVGAEDADEVERPES